MKNIKPILTIVTILFNVNLLRAQSLKPNVEVSAIHSIFKTQASYKSMFVKNINNKLDKQIPGYEAENIDFNFADKKILSKCFKAVFSITRLKELLPENHIFFNAYISSSGKILEVTFVLNQNTLVTATELEELEHQIKNNLAYKVPAGILKENKFYVVGLNVKFDKILDGTL